MRIEFTVPAVPVAQPRPRAVSRGGFASVYEAPSKHKIHSFKASVKLAASQAYQGAPLDGPLAMSLLFLMPRKSGMIWKSKPMPRAYYTSARGGDVDNLAKAVCDALNELTYVDDRLVVKLVIEKLYAAGDEQPRVEVVISSL